jgi:hypothetical protein
MRNHYNSSRQALGQYFTLAPVAKLLAAQLPRQFSSVLELGAGEGALLSAALKRQREARAVAVELDESLAAGLEKIFPGQTVLTGNALDPRLQAKISQAGPFDVTIGNPPFSASKLHRGADMGAEHTRESAIWFRTEQQFVEAAMRLIGKSGAGAFILPLSLFTDPSHRLFRTKLIQSCYQLRVVELPKNSFIGTEVKTAVVSLRWGAPKRSKITVARTDANLRINEEISVSPDAAQQRLDCSYYVLMKRFMEDLGPNHRCLADITSDVLRGNMSASSFRQQGIPHIHTSDLPVTGIGKLRFGVANAYGRNSAERGDILLPRVGTRCLIRQARVVAGNAPITDCVFRLRPRKSDRELVLNALASPMGMEWRKLHARGSCVQHLTITDLLKMPVPT